MKTATATAKTARRFGAGILPTMPHHWSDHTADDERWLIEDNARRAEDARLDRLVDDLAAEREALDRYERGLE